MDKIVMEQLTFYGYHGVFAEEKKLGQHFIVDLVLELPLKEAGETDELEKSIDYSEVYTCVQEIVEGKPYKLIEAVAETIAQSLLSTFDLLTRCTIKVTKPNPPIKGHYRSVAVEVTRTR